MRISRLWLVLTLWLVAMEMACDRESEQKSVPPQTVLAPVPAQGTVEPDHQGSEIDSPDSQHEMAVPTATPDVQSARDQGGNSDGQQSEAAVPPVSQDVQNARHRLGSGGSGFFPEVGLTSLEELMLKSEMVARVDYLSSQGSVLSPNPPKEGRRVSVLRYQEGAPAHLG